MPGESVAHSRQRCCVGDGQLAVWIRRTEFEECRTPLDHSLLVKLGGHTHHDSRTPSTCGRPCSGVTVPGPWRVPLGSSTREPRPSGVAAPEWGDVDRGQRSGCHLDDEFHRFSRMEWQSLPRLRSTKCSLAPPCGRAWTPQTELWYDHREAQWRGSSRHLPRPRPGSTLRASLSSFCVASGASSLCVLQLAGVASHFVHVVTTGELALTQGFLVAAGSRWKVALHESAERQAPGCRSTSVSKTWISIQGREQIMAVWKWSPTVCLSSTAHSMPWTPRWSAQCELTEPPGGSVQNGTEPPWTKPAARRTHISGIDR